MGLLLRGCFLCQQKLFKQEIISVKRLVAHSVYNNNVKKFIPTLQVKHFSSGKDKDNDGELIYTGLLSNKIRYLKIFSLSSTAISLGVQPIFYSKLVLEDNIAHLAVLFVFVNFMCLCSPLLIHMFTRRYALKMYYNFKEGNYIATVYKFFMKEKEIIFKAEDVKGDTKAMFTNCTVNGKPLMFDKDGFIDTKHYYILMEQRKLEDYKVEELVVHSVNRPQITHKNHSQIESKHQRKQ